MNIINTELFNRNEANKIVTKVNEKIKNLEEKLMK